MASEFLSFNWGDGNVRHLARHGVITQEAEECYLNDPLIVEEHNVEGEDRYVALSETDASRRLTFVFTIRAEQVRFITAYPMSKTADNLGRRTIAMERSPSFSSEQEEAECWDSHPEALSQRFEDARRNGTLRRLSVTELPGAKATAAVHISAHELTRARELASKRGMSYQTYVETLLHDALDSEEKRLAS